MLIVNERVLKLASKVKHQANDCIFNVFVLHIQLQGKLNPFTEYQSVLLEVVYFVGRHLIQDIVENLLVVVDVWHDVLQSIQELSRQAESVDLDEFKHGPYAQDLLELYGLTYFEPVIKALYLTLILGLLEP